MFHLKESGLATDSSVRGCVRQPIEEALAYSLRPKANDLKYATTGAAWYGPNSPPW